MVALAIPLHHSSSRPLDSGQQRTALRLAVDALWAGVQGRWLLA